MKSSKQNKKPDTKLGKQTAALPIRWDEKGKLRVLMVTSRETRRWVMPKGWIMDPAKPWATAEIEALEEAGAEGYIGSEPIGDYYYNKVLEKKKDLRCHVLVYPMIVNKLKSRWKERQQRERRWFSPTGAAKRVHEPELAELLLSLTKKPRKQPQIALLLKAG